MLPRPIIEAFDDYLVEHGLRLEAVVIGGAALALLGVIDRQTRDVDLLHPELSEDIAQAGRVFAEQMRKEGVELGDDWLNNGPIELRDILPEGWDRRLQPAYEGKALTLMSLGRAELLKTKLFALCDRGTDLGDCIALAPTDEELDEAISWLADQDAHPMWPAHVRATLDDLRQRR